jgi:hypothetical protein
VRSLVVTSDQIPIGPWLLFESSEEIKTKVFRWGSVTDEEMKQYEIDLRRWGNEGVHMLLSNQHYGSWPSARGWPWNGYELIRLRKAGKYPPQRSAPALRSFNCAENRLLVRQTLCLPNYPVRIFVVSQSDEFGMSQMVGTCPLQERYLCHRFSLEPQCRMPDYAELGCCECCHYCVQRHFVRDKLEGVCVKRNRAALGRVSKR